MSLSEFIRRNEERILQDWEAFARELVTAPDEMSQLALRDHAHGMLHRIAEDLDESKDIDKPEQIVWVSPRGREETAAEAHGGDRKQWGFSVIDMVAEFRALRRSVIGMWVADGAHGSSQDLIRFNEIIDRDLAESLNTFSREKEQQTRLLEAMLRYTSDQSAVLDLEGHILFANRAMAEAHGSTVAELVGWNIDRLDPVVAHEMRHHLRQVSESGEESRSEVPLTTRSGEMTITEYLFEPIVDRKGRIEAVAVNARDVTERKAMEARLWRHANHDALTGIPNRRLFFDRLDQDMRLAKRNGELMALLYIDLDKFKEANDRLGHEGGDELLKQASERVQGCIRETDTLARMGGDEFTLILVNAGDDAHVRHHAQRIVETLTRPFAIGHESAAIGCSIGIALYPQHGSSVHELVVHADQAMYEAKRAGGNRARVFHGREPKRASRRDTLQAAPTRREQH